MTPCPRPGCGGSVVADWDGRIVCHLCARGLTAARPPTAEERYSVGPGKPIPTSYSIGIYDPNLSEAQLRAYRAD